MGVGRTSARWGARPCCRFGTIACGPCDRRRPPTRLPPASQREYRCWQQLSDERGFGKQMSSPACRSRTVLWGPWRRRRPRRAARARRARPGRSRTRSWPARSPCRRGCAAHSVRLPRLRETSETSAAHQLFSPWSAPNAGNGSEISSRQLRKERRGATRGRGASASPSLGGQVGLAKRGGRSSAEA